jgi:hypothetical protein
VINCFGYVAAVRTAEWNYSAVWNREKFTGEYKAQLYNRLRDPDELVDLAAGNPSVIRELHPKLEQYISSGWEITKGSFNEKEA